MNGCQLTFCTERNRRHGHQTVCEWLLHEARGLGIRGATVISCAQGVGHAGALHAAHALSLGDQPQQVILAATDADADRLLEIVRAANVHVFFTRTRVEFGWIGGDEADAGAEGRHRRLFSRHGR
ncbi:MULTISPECIES: DUF190 domain-containing protein [Paraburkholderia]|uniref:DUF190 domain-containing protein n=1 Tax=Paraburkholderia caribensis TaxID=75105 RepID=A0A9Q6WP18_9BURK|nr:MULTISPECIES: DUF190 domain-containing protein [Paraburkholderia]AMV44977.1 hypothetical protein ATN79_23825 [Paraburkholderia caribensis]MCO4881700.1 DUF190 domain-containing protein [Paraburkholderia caribensis]PTB23893.1 hypothetical protein C9I56_36715 [Paraburkholderia caribensis]QLB65820.1 hypothetical protein A9O66_26180 [Paraburkholderia caribensis]